LDETPAPPVDCVYISVLRFICTLVVSTIRVQIYIYIHIHMYMLYMYICMTCISLTPAMTRVGIYNIIYKLYVCMYIQIIGLYTRGMNFPRIRCTLLFGYENIYILYLYICVSLRICTSLQTYKL